MLLSEEQWMDLRAFRSLKAAGATWADIAREAGCDWRTAKKYLSEQAPATPHAVTGRCRSPRLIDPWTETIDAWLTAEPRRRFEVLPGAQAQVDRGDEGVMETETGPIHVYSFHMTLSYSRDPFACFVSSQDLVTFWDCHRQRRHSSLGMMTPVEFELHHATTPAG